MRDAGDERDSVLGEFLAQRAEGVVVSPGRGNHDRAGRLRNDPLDQIDAALPELPELAREAHVRRLEEAVGVQEEHRG